MLNNFVIIYVPSTQRNGSPVENRDILLHNIQTELAEYFGGSTSTEGKGAWIDEQTKKVVFEPVTLVKSFCTNAALLNYLPQIHALAKNLAIDANQDAVSVQINESLEFVAQAEAKRA